MICTHGRKKLGDMRILCFAQLSQYCHKCVRQVHCDVVYSGMSTKPQPHQQQHRRRRDVITAAKNETTRESDESKEVVASSPRMPHLHPGLQGHAVLDHSPKRQRATRSRPPRAAATSTAAAKTKQGQEDTRSQEESHFLEAARECSGSASGGIRTDGLEQ